MVKGVGQQSELDLSAYQTALAGVIVGVAFYASAKLGLALSFPPDYVAVLWPPNSVMVAALLLTVPRTWWVYFFAMAAAYFPAAFQAGYSRERVFVFFTANCSEVLIASLVVRRFIGRAPRLESFREVGIFILAAVIFAERSSSDCCPTPLTFRPSP